MNLPNLVTVARILLVPVFMVLGYGNGRSYALGALAVFGVASATDRLDGHLARRSNQITRTGQFLDPLADKLLVGAALVVLVDTRGFPVWAALIIVAREVAVQVLRTRIVHGGGTMPASAAGKTKTVLQFTMVAWWLLPWSARNVGHWVLLVLTLVSTVWSGVAYFAHPERTEERMA